MNYFELHIGDYAEATAHLTFVEDAAYIRLIRKYYATEKPLPPDIEKVQRMVGARTKEEKNAVATVLEEFFFLEDDGYHNKRCDQVIADFIDGEPEREIKKANENNRTKRHREERANLFKALTDAGLHAPWNIGIVDLREMVKRLTETQPVTPVTAPVTQPVTAPATPVTATQYPIPNTHSPTPNTQNIKTTHTHSDPPPIRVIEPADRKFRMHDEWQPDPETLRTVLTTAALVTAEMITPEAIGEFRNYWVPEQKVFAERQWISKLCQSIAAKANSRPTKPIAHAGMQKTSGHARDFSQIDYTTGVDSDGKF